MFGYVRPALDKLDEENRDRFQAAYCGLCHTLGRRYGFTARLFLNYDLTFLAMLLGHRCGSSDRHCVVHPIRKRPCACESEALDTAADLSVILLWWQLQDGIADHGFFRGLKYRAASLLLRRAYRKASVRQPSFDENTRLRLDELSRLERENCPAVDPPADCFARLLAHASESEPDPTRRLVLAQLLYHLGRWIYLVDALDDLKEDSDSGSYNPLLLRYKTKNGELQPEDKARVAASLDASVRTMAAAFELADFGCWTGIIESVVYEGLYAVGGAVLQGTYQKSKRYTERQRKGRTQ